MLRGAGDEKNSSHGSRNLLGIDLAKRDEFFELKNSTKFKNFFKNNEISQNSKKKFIKIKKRF